MSKLTKIENILQWQQEDFNNFVEQNQGLEGENLPFIAQFLLAKAQKKFDISKNAIDICGTGGDFLQTTNISTISSFVLACMEIPVVKHGGRAVSSSSGSVDFLEALNILTHSPQKTLEDLNICFLKAQNHHPALKHIAPFRKNYGKKTIFNMLGPLLNPVNISHQMVGNSFQLELYNLALDKLNRKQFAIIRSNSGADELLPFEENFAIVGTKHSNETKIINPKEYGFNKKDDSIFGSTPQKNAENMLRFFESPTQNCLFETIALNCGFASFVFEKHSIKNGIELAIETIKSKKPMELVTKMQQKD